MDVWQLIERDHDNIAQLIHDIPNALNGRGIIRSRERLLGDLIDQLETHAEAIDASLYAPLSRDPGTRQLVKELNEEHRVFMRQFASLARYRQKQSAGWLDTFGDATFLVDQHLHRHTHELIPAARRLFARDEIGHATRMFIRAKISALKSRQRGLFGGIAQSDLAVTATVCAAIGGLALIAWRSGLFGGSESRRLTDGGRRGTGPSRTEPAAASAHGGQRKGEKPAERRERLLDEAVEDTFPASDPISAQRFTK